MAWWSEVIVCDELTAWSNHRKSEYLEADHIAVACVYIPQYLSTAVPQYSCSYWSCTAVQPYLLILVPGYVLLYSDTWYLSTGT